ncbi:hypothetical protein D3C75_765890 [compost metagenome]
MAHGFCSILLRQHNPKHIGRPVREGALGNISDTQLRQHIRNIIQEHPVRCEDNHFLRRHLILVLIQQERQPVQRDRGFAAACHTLDNQRGVLRRPDDLVLLLLNRRDDVAETVVLVLTQPVDEEFIRYSRPVTVAVISIRYPFQNLFADHNVALQIDQPFDQPFRGFVGGRFRAAGKRIEQARHRCAPVDHQRTVANLFPVYTDFADIECLAFLLILALKIKPSKVRLLPQLGKIFAPLLP